MNNIARRLLAHKLIDISVAAFGLDRGLLSADDIATFAPAHPDRRNLEILAQGNGPGRSSYPSVPLSLAQGVSIAAASEELAAKKWVWAGLTEILTSGASDAEMIGRIDILGGDLWWPQDIKGCGSYPDEVVVGSKIGDVHEDPIARARSVVLRLKAELGISGA